MDAVDNPDHGRRVYSASGITVVDRQFDRSKAPANPTPAPAGGPYFPAAEDAEINPVPS